MGHWRKTQMLQYSRDSGGSKRNTTGKKNARSARFTAERKVDLEPRTVHGHGVALLGEALAVAGGEGLWDTC